MINQAAHEFGHEIRGALQAIVVEAQLLELSPDEEERRAKILSNCEAMGRTLTNFLTEVDHGKKPPVSGG